MVKRGAKKKLQDPLSFLESKWPGKPSREIRQAFAEIKKNLRQKVPSQEEKETSFNILDVVRRTCAAHDFLFLSRQLTYHIAATADAKMSSGQESRVEAVVSELISHIARRSPRGGRIDIEINEATLRQRPAVEVLFKAADEKTEGLDKTAFIKRLAEAPVMACKEALAREGGQFGVDLPKPMHPVFKVVLKAVASDKPSVSEDEIFKCEITIRNIAGIRKRFGIKKSQSLVGQVENFVRSLLRHPIDVVTASYDKGVITAIYETQKGAAQSVGGRISSRLGAEKFQIGRMQVDLDLGYSIAALPAVPFKRTADAGR